MIIIHSDRDGDRDANMMAAAAGEGQIILFPAATTSSEDLVGCYVQTTTFSSLYSDFYRTQITLGISFWDGSYITHPKTTPIVPQIYSKYPINTPKYPSIGKDNLEDFLTQPRNIIRARVHIHTLHYLIPKLEAPSK